VSDDRLRLIFTCCHPALRMEHQVALTLRLLGGLSVGEVARSFLVSEATMAKRLVRAKYKIRAATIPYRVPTKVELPGRLRSVLSVLYLIYNTGGDDAERASLRSEALRLTRALVGLMADEPEAAGLLRDQDRTKWDRTMIAVRQHIHWAMLFEVNEQRAVGVALAEGEVVHTKNTRRGKGRLWRIAHDAQEGISAHGHAEERAQTGTCLTAKGLSDGQEGARESSCPLGFERQQVGEALSKCASWTGLVIAEEAAHLEQEPNRLSTHGQIAWGAEIAAMNALRELAAGRADTLVDVVCADMTRAVGV
jgi:hypothetical protein